ncbi:MAG: hypothetical protein HC886_00860 [Leptolyngbyaceae cyanobacterium SM1_1_3]|nr:hypothetical protein [Leptolyngbyaceae cyanobacterium SM1_1_3]
MLQDAYDQRVGLKPERSMVISAIATMRVTFGIFFILSGIANYIYFHAPGGFFETVTQASWPCGAGVFQGLALYLLYWLCPMPICCQQPK